jgi:hypothetical protein
LPAKELQIVGEIVPDVIGHPRDVHHGRQPRGATVEEAIRLVSLTGRPFRVTNVRSSSADLEVTRLPDKDRGWLYSLQLRFAATGEQQVQAIFTIQEDDTPEFEVPIPVRYHGFEAP